MQAVYIIDKRVHFLKMTNDVLLYSVKRRLIFIFDLIYLVRVGEFSNTPQHFLVSVKSEIIPVN